MMVDFALPVQGTRGFRQKFRQKNMRQKNNRDSTIAYFSVAHFSVVVFCGFDA